MIYTPCHTFIFAKFATKGTITKWSCEPIFKVFCCLCGKVLNFVLALAKHAGLTFITLSPGFMEHFLSVSLRNSGKLFAHRIGLFLPVFTG